MDSGEQRILNKIYKILEKIGNGGFSAVYLAEDLRDGSKWAIKEYNLTYLDGRSRRKSIKQIQFEASLLLKLSHHQLPRFKDYFIEGDKHYLVMEFIKGKDLYSMVQNSNEYLPEIQIIEWGIEIANILHYLHSFRPVPIIFRDLKPKNIMLTGEGEINLIDFGISKPSEQVTLTTARAYSPGFSPPEQYSMKKMTDRRSDIYSLGATLYFLTSKTIPKEAPVRLLGQETLPYPGQLRHPYTSDRLDSIIIKSMEIKAQMRYNDVIEMRNDLKDLLKNLISSYRYNRKEWTDNTAYEKDKKIEKKDFLYINRDNNKYLSEESDKNIVKNSFYNLLIFLLPVIVIIIIMYHVFIK